MNTNVTVDLAINTDGEGTFAILTIEGADCAGSLLASRLEGELLGALAQLGDQPDGIAGAVVHLIGGRGDVSGLESVEGAGAADVQRFASASHTMFSALRRLERSPFPVVAVLDGPAVGGALEIALSTHRRIAVGPAGAVGFPEITFGLMPSAGGVSRLTHLVGIRTATEKVLLEGRLISPEQAMELGIVDEIAGHRDAALSAARRWMHEHAAPVQPWDDESYRMPGGSATALAPMLPSLPARLRRRLRSGDRLAERNTLAAAVECSQVPFDRAAEVERAYYVECVSGQISTNLIHLRHTAPAIIAAGGSRPALEKSVDVKKAAIIGAGMMGAGIALACARAGIEVVLKDLTADNAQKGKEYSRKALDRSVSKGVISTDEARAILDRIHPTADYADLADAEVIVEAVFEKPELKKQVLAAAEASAAPNALIGSNTSTLPITDLATAAQRVGDVVGLHFFSPADRMDLVEIIVGRQSTDLALARAVDFALQIAKVPIVVNDSRAFFTSRVIGLFLREAAAMVGEGVPPASIEQAAAQTGYPAPPLQLIDELTLTLLQTVARETHRAVAAEGGVRPRHPSEPVIDQMIDEHGRQGRVSGAGFYDYDERGHRTGIWSGIGALAPSGPVTIPFADIRDRMLFVEALETVRCFDEGVLRSAADADVGSAIGIGYPAWTGGVSNFVNQYPGGVAGFVERAHALAESYGERFSPPASLQARAGLRSLSDAPVGVAT